MNNKISRRDALHLGAAAGVGLAVSGCSEAQDRSAPAARQPLKSNLKHSICAWTYEQYSLDQLCTIIKDIGFAAIDLARPEDWPTLKAHGVDCSMCWGAEMGQEIGFANAEHHDELVARYLHHIDLVADAGYRNLICFSGNRNGMDPEQGLINAEAGLKRILGHAEKRGVMIMLELLNSKVNQSMRGHPDYLCDNTPWGVALCERISSPNFALVYDIYHMQIMEGDIITTIRKYHQFFGHYHTAGVPGRNEIGNNQEIYYPAICRAILETGYRGYIAQEFIPVEDDPIASLREAVYLCDV